MSQQDRIALLLTALGADIKSLNTAVGSHTTSITAIVADLGTNHKWIQMTQAAYDALGTKDSAVLYVIVG